MSHIRDVYFSCAGVVFLFLAKLKHLLIGYTTPKPISCDELNACVDYDISVVDEWLRRLGEYSPVSGDVAGKRVLELGPGSDLGIGLYLLSKNIDVYNAVDVNNLVNTASKGFYDQLLYRISQRDNDADSQFLSDELDSTLSGKNKKLNYVCRDDFDLEKALGNNKVDLVFSQAAFEHFDNLDETFRKLSNVADKGAKLVALVDLKTHSRWIRDKDPNNIYRYPQWFYQLFYFRGIPNRVRPYEYTSLLEKHGWVNVVSKPDDTLTKYGLDSADNHYAKEFSDERNEMDYLTFWIYATKA